MKTPNKKLTEMPLRPEAHVQAIINQAAIPVLKDLPEPEPLKATTRLNVDVDTNIYNEAHIKARRQGRKLSDVVRRMLVEYLSE